MRYPSVAGQFYAGDKKKLLEQIEWCYKHSLGPGELPKVGAEPRKTLGLVSPHAGYMYSGPVAAHGFLRIAREGKPEKIIILGPNHTGLGSGVSIMCAGKWKTPLGEVEVDRELASAIVKCSNIIDPDEEAHRFEHSIEVQLPFLQHLFGEFKFVPICMMMQDLTTSLEVGESLARACKGMDVLIIASSDFTHYEPQDVARRKDAIAIEKILSLDPIGLAKVVETENISLCGPGPVCAMLKACSDLGAKKAELLKYATSGDVSGMRAEVVGYASISVTR